MNPSTASHPDRKATASQSVKIQTRKRANRAEIADISAKTQPMRQSGSPPVADWVDPVSL